MQDFRKNTIISRASVLMSQTGFEGFSIKALAEHTGIKAPTILYHFKNKSDIFQEIILKVVSDGKGIVEKRLSQNSCLGLEELQLWVDAHYEWLEQAPYRQSLLLIFYAQALRNPTLKKINAEISKTGLERVKNILNKGKEAKVFSNFDLHSKATQLHSLLTGQLFYFCSAQTSESEHHYGRSNTFKMVKTLLREE